MLLSAHATRAFLAVLALCAACGPAPHRAAESPTPGSAPKAGAIRTAWTVRDLTPASAIEGVDGGFALYTLDRGAFRVHGLDAATGAVRWSQPATPSYTLGGVELALAARGSTAVFMRPVGDYTAGAAQVVAVDAATGAVRWVYGGPGQRITSQPDWCAGGRKICFIASDARFRNITLVVLDAANGHRLAAAPLQDGRSVTDELFLASQPSLVRITTDGTTMWRRPIRELSPDATPDTGWNIELRDGRYLGWLGGRDTVAGTTMNLGRGVFTALEASTGRPLWTRAGADASCGVVEFTAAHPVWCRSTGQITYLHGRPRVRGLDVTLQGFDAATGAVRWSWHAGSLPGLAIADVTVIRVTETTYQLRTPAGLMLLDLDTGVRPISGAPTGGWCAQRTLHTPKQAIAASGMRGYYLTHRWPCDAMGRPISTPISLPAFAGATSGTTTYAWSDRHSINAVTTS